VLARDAGSRIVEMVHEDLRLSHILTRKAFENAIRVNAAPVDAVGDMRYAQFVAEIERLVGRCR
jgi:hypothetical protein